MTEAGGVTGSDAIGHCFHALVLPKQVFMSDKYLGRRPYDMIFLEKGNNSLFTFPSTIYCSPASNAKRDVFFGGMKATVVIGSIRNDDWGARGIWANS